VPTFIEDDLRELTRRLAQRGVGILDNHTVHLDIERRELVVRTSLDIDVDAIRSLVDLAPARRRADPAVPDGRYPLERWLMMELWDPPGTYSRPTATRRASLVLRDGLEGAGPDMLVRLAGLFSAVRAEGIDPGSRAEILGLAIDDW
jgi:hypothetical protein